MNPESKARHSATRPLEGPLDHSSRISLRHCVRGGALDRKVLKGEDHESREEGGALDEKVHLKHLRSAVRSEATSGRLLVIAVGGMLLSFRTPPPLPHLFHLQLGLVNKRDLVVVSYSKDPQEDLLQSAVKEQAANLLDHGDFQKRKAKSFCLNVHDGLDQVYHKVELEGKGVAPSLATCTKGHPLHNIDDNYSKELKTYALHDGLIIGRVRVNQVRQHDPYSRTDRDCHEDVVGEVWSIKAYRSLDPS